MNRKTLISITVFFIIGFAAAGAWFMIRSTARPSEGGTSFFNSLPFIGGGGGLSRGGVTSDADGRPSPDETIGSNTDGATRPIRELIARDILAPTIGRDKQSLYYLARENGHIFSSNLEGANERKLTNLTIVEAFEAFWSPLKTKIAVFYHDSGVVKKFLNETATGTPSKFLPQDLTALSWSPDGLELAYLALQNGRMNLVITDQNGRNARVIYSTPVPDFIPQWIAKNRILLVSRPSALAPSLVLSVNPQNHVVSPILTNREGVVVLGAPDGFSFVFSESSVRDGLAPLSRYDLRTGEIRQLTAETIAEKCAFSPTGKYLFCGVPVGPPPGPFPDAWYRGAAAFTDVIVEFNLEDDTRREITAPSLGVDVINPFTSPDGRFFFFQDKKTGHLWRVTVNE